MALTKYNFKNFDGFIYVEYYEDHKEEERCKIYDENNNYLDYIPVMEFDGVWDEELKEDMINYHRYIDFLINLPDEISFFENFCDSFNFGHSIKQTLNNYINTLYYVRANINEPKKEIIYDYGLWNKFLVIREIEDENI